MSRVRRFRDDVLVEVDGTPHLLGSRCPRCGDVRFPRARACPACHTPGEELADVPLSRHGRVHTFSRVRRAPPPFRAPYVVAFVQLPEGPRVFCQLDCPADAEVIDRAVELVVGPLYEVDGEEVHGYKFRLRNDRP